MPAPENQPAWRVGHGYDLHRLEARPPAGKGRELVLGGVRFPDHPAGPISHSDGDVVYHAATDAILGALAMPDIGQLFPDTDPKHDGADSSIFVADAARRMKAAGWRLGNIDITVICEKPRLGPMKPQMIANLARLLDCEGFQVNLKGKTHEKVDAVGEGRAVEAHVVVLLERCESDRR